jgi:hypothetical protein
MRLRCTRPGRRAALLSLGSRWTRSSLAIVLSVSGAGASLSACDQTADRAACTPSTGPREGASQSSRLLENAARALCQGGGQLDIQIVTSGGFGVTLPIRNGLSQFYVNGECRYWLRPLSQVEMRSGVLSEADAAALTADLYYRDWPRWYGAVSQNNASDPTARTFVDGSGGFSLGGCESGQYSEAEQCTCEGMQAIAQGYQTWEERLYAAASALTGPMRVRAWPLGSDVPTALQGRVYPWPANLPFARVTGLTEADAPLGGILVEGADADALRGLRIRARDERISSAGGDLILVYLEEVPYQVEIDDALPFENADGLVPRMQIEASR